jgi:SAM-dependent methyltransferase
VTAELTFTGERLHDADPLFGVDLAQHRAAYRFAIGRARGGRVLDLGCGTGYGTRELADAGVRVIGVDRVPPVAASRGAGAGFVVASASFDLVVSFQVIEHLEDPRAYLNAMRELVRAQGEVLITTPNRKTSLGVNPYHVREYTAEELDGALAPYFASVEVLGVGASAAVAQYLEGRRQRIERIMRLDPLGLRNWLPRRTVESLFALFAVVVRRGIQKGDGIPDVSERDFPIGAAADDCVDLLALCREPR